MIRRLLMIVGGIAAGAVAAAAVWTLRKAELDARARRAGAIPAADPASLERGLTPLPIEPDAVPTSVGMAVEDEVTRGRITDDLRRIKGVGAVSIERLAGEGITMFRQIAGWSDDDLERVARRIRISAVRMRNEDWVGQARDLARSSVVQAGDD